MSSSLTADVLIVGAGLSGSVAAHSLSKLGLRVAVVDPRPEYPAVFKAEKIESDQADLFREFGLMDALLPHCGVIREVLDCKKGRVYQVLPIEQYGIHYHDMVNAVRRCWSSAVDFRLGRVEEIDAGEHLQRIRLAGGQELSGRLVVLASGTGGELATRLQLRREMVRKEHSTSFGFDIERRDGRAFPFQSLTYYPDGVGSRIGYLTLFLIRHTMRANLFTFHSLSDEWSRALIRQPEDALLKALPKLARLTGDFSVSSRVEAARIDLYRSMDQPRPGLVTLADVGQSVCPTTGTGLSKVLTDVAVLCAEAPRWLETPGMGAEKTATWHDHARKRRVDANSLREAEYRRRLSLDGSLRWRVHRARVDFENRWAGGAEARRFTRKLTA